MTLSPLEIETLQRDVEADIVAVFGYSIARCPIGGRCTMDAGWGHPCPRDENCRYECEREPAVPKYPNPSKENNMSKTIIERRLASELEVGDKIVNFGVITEIGDAADSLVGGPVQSKVLPVTFEPERVLRLPLSPQETVVDVIVLEHI